MEKKTRPQPVVKHVANRLPRQPSAPSPFRQSRQAPQAAEPKKVDAKREDAEPGSREVKPGFGEIKLYGLNACQTLARRRMDDIIRVYVTEDRIKNMGHALSWCAQNKRAYHVVTPEDMARISESVHHEGVCILAKARKELDFGELVARERTISGPRCIVYLENVGNPHNLGAILRVCSHFGAQAVLVYSEDGSLKGMSPVVYRTAEGGAETVDVIFTQEPSRALKALRNAGFTLMATSSHCKESLFDSPLPQKLLVMLGSESSGLSSATYREAQLQVQIPGSGDVESLNVACAASTILGEYWREYRVKKTR
jgi:TrmH RNA methyltransferase